jgi:hypothetical protein
VNGLVSGNASSELRESGSREIGPTCPSTFGLPAPVSSTCVSAKKAGMARLTMIISYLGEDLSNLAMGHQEMRWRLDLQSYGHAIADVHRRHLRPKAR